MAPDGSPPPDINDAHANAPDTPTGLLATSQQRPKRAIKSPDFYGDFMPVTTTQRRPAEARKPLQALNGNVPRNPAQATDNLRPNKRQRPEGETGRLMELAPRTPGSAEPTGPVEPAGNASPGRHAEPARNTGPAEGAGPARNTGDTTFSAPPGGHLQQELQAALSARDRHQKEMDQEALAVIELLDQKLALWDQKKFHALCQLGNTIRLAAQNYAKAQDPTAPSGPQTTYAEAAAATPPAASQPTARPAAVTSKTNSSPGKKGNPPHQMKAERPPRLFLRLPEKHPARNTSLHATVLALRQKLPITHSQCINEIQHIPTGLAICPKDSLGAQLLASRKNEIAATIDGAKAEMEEKWAVFVIPETPQYFRAFDGTEIAITDEMALDEFKLQTGLPPVRLHRTNKATGHETGTIIVTVHEECAPNMPRRVYLFGQTLRIFHKTLRPRTTQCPRCWGFHNPRTCTRQKRCRLCHSAEHQEDTHPIDQEQRCCTNCLGSHPADHTDCLVRPRMAHGVMTRLARSQVNAIRRSNSRMACNNQNQSPTQQAAHGSQSPSSQGAPPLATQCSTPTAQETAPTTTQC